MLGRIFSNRLTVRQRLIALATTSVLTAVVVAAAGLVANEYSRQLMSRADDLTAMISNHKDIDTMHDSLRAYVLLTIRQLQQPDAPVKENTAGDSGVVVSAPAPEETGDGMDLAAIQDEYKEHQEEMFKALAANRQLATSMGFAEAAQILDGLAPLLEDAATDSAAVVLTPPADMAVANEKASKFLRDFKQPEEKMDNLADMLDARLEQGRADSAAAVATTRWIFVGVCAAGALLILSLAVATFRSIVRPLTAFTQAIRRLADSDHGGEIPGLDRSDEIREMAVALATLRDVSIEAARAKSSLEGVSANVMVADAEGKIVFMNKTVTAMLRNAEADIRKDLPRFDTSSLIGRSFDEFHKNPVHQRNLLANLTSTYHTQIKIGGRTFNLIANPAVNERGERVGTAVEWADMTQELAVQEEVALLVTAVAAGDLSRRLPLEGKAGFMKALGQGINQVTETVNKAVAEIATMMSAMAQGDLSKRVSGDYQGEFSMLKTDANATAEKLAQIVGQTVEGMANIKASTTEIASGATDLSSRTEEQVASLEEIATSIRQLNTTVQQSAENAGQATQLAVAARASAEGGGEIAGAAVKAMGEIEQSSHKISDIVGMIDEIAFQTNLLALNAAVEAARAGEAGRGFAVVAGEVRMLAQRSSQASKEIKALITNSNSQVKQGVELVNRAGSTLGEIVTSVKRVSDIVADIAAANRAQSASVAEVQEAIGQIEQATQQNAALVEETTAALGSADSQVRGVTDVISFFRSDGVATASPANAPSSKGRSRRLAATGTD
jgi:methyl-accepting chemotaxis protein